MSVALVTQLRFARSELIRCLDGVSKQDGIKSIPPMNCISWIIGHLAGQEQYLWVQMAQGKVVAPNLNEITGFGKPASTPDLDQMWATWRAITFAADRYLDSLSEEDLDQHLEWKGKPFREDIGKALMRNIFHYWFHIGEAHAIRQTLGHEDLPQFVGSLTSVRYQ